MQKIHRMIPFLLAPALACSAFTGCTSEEDLLEVPFTEITWDATLDDILEVEGDDYETTDSVYDGTTYIFSNTYMDKDGQIKYMFDDDDQLVSMAWQYFADDADELDEIYNTLHEEIEDAYGESGYDNQLINAYGDVWYLDGGDIVLGAVATDESFSVMYSYIHPDVADGGED